MERISVPVLLVSNSFHFLIRCSADEGLIGEFEVEGESLVMTRSYGYLPDTSVPLFVMLPIYDHHWYITDRLGTPQKLISQNGTVVWSAEYDAFGKTDIGVEQRISNLRLPGQYYDAETGLYYNLNRYYDPKTGRYLQTDPAGDGLNPYLYAAANPVNAIDPNGLCALRMVGGGA